MSEKQRIRKIDVNSLSEEQMISVQEGLGKKLSEILKSAVEQANLYFNVYGLQVTMKFEVKAQDHAETESEEDNLNKESGPVVDPSKG